MNCLFCAKLGVLLAVGCCLVVRLSAEQHSSPIVDDTCAGPRRDCSPYASRSSSYCYQKAYKYEKRSTGGSWWRSTKYYSVKKSYTKTVCCSGHSGSYCYPTCHGSNSLNSCNRYEGNIKFKDGSSTTCSGGACKTTNNCVDCNTGYYSSSDGWCRACKTIDNCDIPTCSDGDRSTCLRCAGEVKCDTPGLYAYTKKPDNSKCQRACSWRSGARCYPGTCEGNMLLASDCKCADGFTNHGDCDTFSSSADELLKPQVLKLEALLERDGDTTKLIIPDPQYPEQKVWTNAQDWSKIELLTKGYFKVSGATPAPAYIVADKTKIGVKSVRISSILRRVCQNGALCGNGIRNMTFTSGSVSTTWTVTEDSCDYDTNCRLDVTPTSLQNTQWNSILKGGYPKPFAHLDSITFSVYVENGGIVTYNDWENLNSQDLHYKVERSYSIKGITVSKTVTMGFDLYTPTHCAETAAGCSIEPLIVPDFFETSSIDVSWDGWADQDSGLHYYEVHLLALKLYDTSAAEPLLDKEHAILFDTVVNATSPTTATVEFEHPGPYYVELIVFDWAGNHKSTRRICLYDNNSTVQLTGYTPNVTIATVESERKWINKEFSQLTIVWTDRFINTKHHVNGWLNGVEGLDDISRELDDTSGKSERTTEKFHNIQGIIKTEVGYQIDAGFGSPIETVDFVTVSQAAFDAQALTVDEESKDGDKYTFTIRGYDVLDKYAEDSFSVKVDASPPVITYLWLTKGDIVNISVHDVKEFKELTIEWEVYDQHSGIAEISWKLFDNSSGDSILHGKAHETAQGDAATIEDCETKYAAYARGPQCYCTPFDGCYHRHYQVKPLVTTTNEDGLLDGKHIGIHDGDYFLEVVAINWAGLETRRDFKLTIDTSPPHQGSVNDGLAGQEEIDFQQSLYLASNWNGFFDKESGVWFYLYKYDTKCIPDEEFDLNWIDDHLFTKTYNTEGYHEVSEPGTYYVTVVAYNHALDHSLPVCSDGVMIDSTMAEISEVVVQGAVTLPGLVITADNHVMFLHDDRTLQAIESPSQECIDKAVELTEDQLGLVPERRDVSGNKTRYVPSESDCSTEGVRESHFMSFVSSDSHLDISWNVTSTPSGIHDYEVGLASVEGTNPDRLSFRSTKQHQRIRLLYTNIWNGQEFYILVKTVTKASIENIQTIGPFVVCKTAPSFTGTITVQFEKDVTNDYLIASWAPGSFQCDCDPYQLHLEVGVGTDRYHANVLSFTKLSTGGSCTDVASCTAVDVKSIPWNMHGYREYYIVIKVTNIADLFTVVSSDAYKHDVELASEGVVIDIDKDESNLFDDTQDIDFQVKTNELTVTWYGFEHPYLDIRYIICLREKGVETFMKCEEGSDNKHTMTGITLETFKTYLQVVIAETSYGNVSASSDGVTIFNDGDQLQNVVIYDGKGLVSSASQVDTDSLHHDTDRAMADVEDLEYQKSTSELHAHWTVPADITHFTSDIYWAVEERAGITEHWETTLDYQHHRFTSNISVHDLFLDSGRKYRFAIKFCAELYCFQPLHSNGVMIVPNPPVTGTMNVDFNNVTNLISVEMARFYDPDIPNFEEAVEIMDHYEWTISDNSHHGRIVFKWSHVTIQSTGSTQLSFTLPTDKAILFTKCWRLSIRGYTKAGLYSTVSSDIRNCTDIQQVRPAKVIDAVGPPVLSIGTTGTVHEGQPISLAEDAYWLEEDKDYTTYNNIISAVWPTLRYKKYAWAVIEARPTDPALYYDASSLELQQPCSHPDKIACNETDKEFMNAYIPKDVLQHGRRYVVCIHANATTNVFEKWTQELPDLSVCSNGITVDFTPPTSNDVWIGNQQGQIYQTMTSDLSVSWKSFTDVEEEGNGVHHSGIMKYEVAIGSAYNGVDVVDFTDVGVTNHVTFHGLRLQQGHTYFATVRATDFTGQSSNQTSPSIKVDTTAPELTEKSVTLNNRRITSTTSVAACWTGVFFDEESGISHYEWGVGSHPGYDDLYKFTIAYQECAGNAVDEPLDLIEGHAYFISVKAHNNAGLIRIASSWAFTVDATAPNQGHVYDGPKGENGTLNDIDYVTNTSVIEAHWTEFYDHHSTVIEYYVSVGTCKGCDDVLQQQPVGIMLELRLDMLHLVEGIQYFVTVMACNTANLCSSSSSDGVIVDTSPPMAGRVLDGIDGHDIQYQASRLHLGAEWFSFVDPQSGISHYVWRVGTEKYGDNILVATNVHKQQESFIIDYLELTGNQLPIDGTQLYSTIRAYNRAGMYTEACSNGFIIDNSAPVFIKPLTQSSLGMASEGTSVLRSVLKVEWDVQDSESYIEEQYLSISSHAGGDFNLSSTKVEGIVRDYTFTDLQLHDGSFYDIYIIACNGAKQCSESTVGNVLVDSTAPTPGMFAIDTDHAANLKRQPNSWMSWTVVGLRLAWIGFEDLHSGIDKYFINVGKTFFNDDLNKNPGVPITVEHSDTGEVFDEGTVQVIDVQTAFLTNNMRIFISMWAVNKAGLPSSILHGEFELVFGGIMSLVRRCEAHTCYGHCVCAPHGQTCESDTLCNDVSTNNGNTLLDVQVLFDLTFPTMSSPVLHTPVNSIMVARWTTTTSQGKPPQWYEWSVGESAYDVPKGVFNEADERVWHDAGRNTSWVVTLSEDHLLQELLEYCFFVRVWYDTSTFAVFKSNSVMIYSKPPLPVTILGKTVKEVIAGSTLDIDFFDESMRVLVDWDGKFNDNKGSLEKYHVYISTARGGNDTHILGVDLDTSTVHVNITGLQFKNNTRYYSVVQAYNKAGLHTIDCSDGFMIDSSPPNPGVVHDGEGLYDLHALNSSDLLSGFWFGFTDLESGIKHYETCISTRTNGRCNIKPWSAVGIATKSFYVNSEYLNDASNVYHYIRAVDASGQVSVAVRSSGVTIDRTAPVKDYTLEYGSSLLNNPSFELNDSPVDLENFKDIMACEGTAPLMWTTSDDSCIVHLQTSSDNTPDGTNFVVLSGSISQSANLTSGKYRLSFHTSHILSSRHSELTSAEGYVDLIGKRHVFLIHNKPSLIKEENDDIPLVAWQQHQYFFHLEKPEEITIMIGTARKSAHFAIDHVQLQARVAGVDPQGAGSAHVAAHTVFTNDWSSIHAEWNFVDEESVIVEYLWAIGTVQGGTQLQEFKTVGRQTFAYAYDLHLVHNSIVHVTVVAVNRAGLRTVSYSDPIIIDKTPPVFQGINDGTVLGEDIDVQKIDEVAVTWSVYDPESGILECEWALGDSAGDASIQSFTVVPESQTVASVVLTSIPDTPIYATVKCTNKAFLTTTMSTNGILIRSEAPSIDNVFIEILGVSQTQYIVHDGYHGVPDYVRFRWTGFLQDDGIDSFTVGIRGPGVDENEVVKSSTSSFSYASFMGLALQDGNYTVYVIGKNQVKKYSERVSKDFILLTEAPDLTGQAIETTWTLSNKTLHVSWIGVFYSSYPMYYEVTAKLAGAEGDLIQWQETNNLVLDISLNTDKIAEDIGVIHITVRAISYCGLYTTARSEKSVNFV